MSNQAQKDQNKASPAYKDDGLSLSDFMPFSNANFESVMGEKLEDGSAIASKEQLIAAICQVYDPEIPVNLWDLGLIYNLDISDQGDIDVDMTLTAPGCPVAGEMPAMVARAISGVEGTGVVTVRLVWEPRWTKDKMSDDARLLLDM